MGVTAHAARGIARVGRDVAETVREEHLTFLAGSIAHSAFVSVIPLTVLVLIVLSAAGSDALAHRAVAVIDATLAPGSAALLSRARESATTATGVSVAGLLVLLWGATRLFRGLDVAFSTLYGSEPSNTFANRLRDGVAVFAAFAASVTVMLVAESALSGVGGDAVALLTPIGIVAGLALALFPVYYVFPDVDVGALEVLPGVLLAAVGWSVLAELFRVYLDVAGRFETYGAFGSALVLATWLYLASLLLLLGASVNVVRRGDPATPRGSSPRTVGGGRHEASGSERAPPNVRAVEPRAGRRGTTDAASAPEAVFAGRGFIRQSADRPRMAGTPDVDAVEDSDDYYHVRFRDPDEFSTIRTPDWAANAASSVVAGSEVRTGKRTDGDDWEVQSVLVDDEVDRDEAESRAREIVRKIES